MSGLLLAVLLATAAVPPALASPSNPLPKVGSFQFGTVGGSPTLSDIDNKLRLVVAASSDGLFLVDADRMRVKRRISFPFPAGGRLALDAVNHRLFVPHGHPLAPDPRSVDPPSISVLNLPGGTVIGTYTFPETFRGHGIDATGFFARDDRLYVVTDVIATFEQPLHRLTVHELDATKVASGSPDALVWSYDLDSCNNIPDSASKFGFIYRSERADFLYFPCDTGSQGPSNGLVRLDIPRGSDASDTSRFSVDYRFFGGGLTDGFVVADPAQDHVLIFASSAGKQKLYVFDAFDRAWLGSVPLGNSALGGGGFDPTTGRIYATQIPRGMLVTEGSWIPTPQGRSYATGLPSLASGNPVFDPRTRRLFVPAYRNTRDGIRVPDAVFVYEDRIPRPSPPEPADADVRTQNVPEVPGGTVSTYSGGGSAYGARYLLTGGLQNKLNGALWPAVQAIGSVYSGATGALGQEGANAPFAPGGSGRTVLFGRVSDLFVDSSTATAKAISTDADAVTDGDIAQLRDIFAPGDVLPSDPGDPDVLRQGKAVANQAASAAKEQLRDAIRWPYDEADCVDFGNRDDTTTSEKPGAEVHCDHATPKASASAASAPELGDAPVQIAYGRSTLEAVRDPARGMVIKATAFARNVDVGGLLSIGEVSTVAEAVAFGRPGTAKTTFRRLMKEVVIRDSSGKELFECGFGSASCDPLVFASAAARYLPTRIRVDVPQPETDPRVARTPGGAQAVVAKSALQFWSDFNSNGESSYEVPGLVISIFDDAFPHILQLAGVTVDAHYTVTAVTEPPDEVPGSPVRPPPPLIGAPVLPGSPTVVPGSGPQRSGGGPASVVRRAAHGVALALARPREGLLLAAFWSLAAIPAYLALRRRSLRRILKEDGTP
jgi:hypothetical protein